MSIKWVMKPKGWDSLLCFWLGFYIFSVYVFKADDWSIFRRNFVQQKRFPGFLDVLVTRWWLNFLRGQLFRCENASNTTKSFTGPITAKFCSVSVQNCRLKQEVLHRNLRSLLSVDFSCTVNLSVSWTCQQTSDCLTTLRRCWEYIFQRMTVKYTKLFSLNVKVKKIKLKRG